MRVMKSIMIEIVACTVITIAALISSSDFACADVSVLNDGAVAGIGTILIHGDITKGDLAAFRNAADKISQITKNSVNGVPLITVELDTPGGDVMEATQIGRLVHERFMFTVVKPKKECASACVFILIAGAVRTPTDEARVGLHRPSFDPSYFASLTPAQARAKYDVLLDNLRDYFIEMGGNQDAFRLMLSTPSDRIRFLSTAELDSYGLRGQDPSWEELSNAKMIEQYGPIRWPITKRCSSISGNINACAAKAYKQYPAN